MHVFLLAATSTDGFIGKDSTERSFEWTSPEDKQFYVSMLKKADVIVMGNRTFQTFSRYPKNSRWIIYTSRPEKFENPKPQVIKAEATSENPKALIERLEKEGCKEVAICGGASIYSLFMDAGLIDTLYLTVEPVTFGSGVKLFQNEHNFKLDLIKSEKLNDQGTMLMEYEVRRGK